LEFSDKFLGSGFIQLEEFSLRFHVQILPSGCSVRVLTEVHGLLDSSTLGIFFNNNQIFLGFGETCNVTDSTHLSQASKKSTHQQSTHYAQHRKASERGIVKMNDRRSCCGFGLSILKV
jgi:hypothetical protein